MNETAYLSSRHTHEVVFAPKREHSEKSEEVRRRIERLFPGLYLELYGRKLVDGWAVWGDEIPRPGFGSRPIAPADEAERESDRCHCGAPGESGYRDEHGVVHYFCAERRLAEHYADARIKR